jgi:hypothetical protein
MPKFTIDNKRRFLFGFVPFEGTFEDVLRYDLKTDLNPYIHYMLSTTDDNFLDLAKYKPYMIEELDEWYEQSLRYHEAFTVLIEDESLDYFRGTYQPFKFKIEEMMDYFPAVVLYSYLGFKGIQPVSFSNIEEELDITFSDSFVPLPLVADEFVPSVNDHEGFEVGYLPKDCDYESVDPVIPKIEDHEVFYSFTCFLAKLPPQLTEVVYYGPSPTKLIANYASEAGYLLHCITDCVDYRHDDHVYYTYSYFEEYSHQFSCYKAFFQSGFSGKNSQVFEWLTMSKFVYFSICRIVSLNEGIVIGSKSSLCLPHRLGKFLLGFREVGIFDFNKFTTTTYELRKFVDYWKSHICNSYPFDHFNAGHRFEDIRRRNLSLGGLQQLMSSSCAGNSSPLYADSGGDVAPTSKWKCFRYLDDILFYKDFDTDESNIVPIIEPSDSFLEFNNELFSHIGSRVDLRPVLYFINTDTSSTVYAYGDSLDKIMKHLSDESSNKDRFICIGNCSYPKFDSGKAKYMLFSALDQSHSRRPPDQFKSSLKNHLNKQKYRFF